MKVKLIDEVKTSSGIHIGDTYIGSSDSRDDTVVFLRRVAPILRKKYRKAVEEWLDENSSD